MIKRFLAILKFDLILIFRIIKPIRKKAIEQRKDARVTSAVDIKIKENIDTPTSGC
tara:strand:+ start:203 stop:370 length:168 start_codon:yes stop_codon:yes gene_type:complete